MDNLSEEQKDMLNREISAMIIQRFHKRVKYHIALKQMVRSLESPIQVYYSDINVNMKQKSDTDRLFHLLNSKKMPYFKHNLVNNPVMQQRVANELNSFPMPLVYIVQNFIGGFEDLLKLVENELVPNIINKQYLLRCLLCQKDRKPGAKCHNCGKEYNFFVKK